MGGSKTAILAQVVHFYFGAVGHITIGGDKKIWLVTFMHYDLGFFDEEYGRVECAENPFGAKLLPMSPE
jgi:hypothetical protein